MASLLACLLAFALLFSSCAPNQESSSQSSAIDEQGVSGAKVSTDEAVGHSQFVFVGKLLNSRISDVPQNTFFKIGRSDVSVQQKLRGQVPERLTVRYSLEGGARSPYRVGEVYIFCIDTQSAVDPDYIVGKILSATPANLAEVTSLVHGG